ncbi:MAG: exonuclease subunit SbcD [Pseudoflavonifractor sp.]|nr:exonuclease subunit SbcD [Alloprevotella sp.]MCM1116626.1 exonuclease subunit SbcD [Pseudoflavonifractor sp.]
MKIFATGDWHLGNTFMGLDRLPEQRAFLSWLQEQIAAEEPDLLLVAGDIFDNPTPSNDASAAYYGFLGWVMTHRPELRIVIIAGNHDSASRLEAPRSILSQINVEIRGSLTRRWVAPEKDCSGHWVYDYDDLIIPVEATDGSMIVAVVAVPYLRADIVSSQTYSAGVNDILRGASRRARDLYPDAPIVMMTHTYASGASIAAAADRSERMIGGQEEVILEDWEDHPAFLVSGHIHRAQWIWGTQWARYPGSVLPMSIAERDYEHGIDTLEVEPGGSVATGRITFKPPHRLVVVPGDDSVMTLDKICKTLRKELKEGSADGLVTEAADYVVVRLNTDKGASDEDRARLEKAMEGKDAILLAVKAMSPALNITSLSGDTRIMTTDDIVNRDPREALLEAFEVQNGGAPDERQACFIDEIVEEVMTNLSSCK